ncbi:unnamed protein product [Schistosoma rodhaini]|uniref:ATPase_AAA_core domain-containing protein n=1 Tax=Schistosoma rodhaini TaxID=6188 RepID=A0AA85FVV9_9TREM|nr:unnamed protein product [Schistosoma rodhaini]CAH8569212.1 unnamed protein product [Schistosoma rodhaini]
MKSEPGNHDPANNTVQSLNSKENKIDVQKNNITRMSYTEFLTSLKNGLCVDGRCDSDANIQNKFHESLSKSIDLHVKANEHVCNTGVAIAEDFSNTVPLCNPKVEFSCTRSSEDSLIVMPDIITEALVCSEPNMQQSCFSGLSQSPSQTKQKMAGIYLSKTIDSDTCLRKIVDDHPNFPIFECFQKFQSSTTGCTKSRQIPSASNESLLWVDKYMPSSCSSFLNTCPGIIKLLMWLKKWKYKNSKVENSMEPSLSKNKTTKSTKKRLRSSPRYSSDEDFVVKSPAHKRHKYNVHVPGSVENINENPTLNLPIGYIRNQIDVSSSSSSDEDNSTESDEEHNGNPNKRRFRTNWQSKAFLLVGPHGTGKSALIYALAKDLGFKIFELNPSSRRSGKDIISQFHTALGSHHVAKDYLSTSFSTFQMITSSSLTKNNSETIRKSAANFFKPVPKKNVSSKKNTSSTKDSESLNLNCNSIVLFDEVDVLFESDRGFWSGLSSLLQLARRPVILTASDSSIVHNLPVPAYICHFTSASLELVVPYIRVLCLNEGYNLDVQTANSLIKSIQSPNLTIDKLSSEHCDLRRLINELQWFCTSASHEEANRKYNHIKNENSLVLNEFIDDPLTLVQKISPSLCNLSGHIVNPKPPVNSKCVIDNDLCDLFTTDAENVSDQVAGKATTNEIVKENVIVTNCQDSVEKNQRNSLLIDFSLNSLKEMTENLSFWDICQSGVTRASLLSVTDSISQIIDIKSNSNNNDSNNSPSNTNPSVNVTSDSSMCTVSTKRVINVPTQHWGPVCAFDIINDDFFNVFWIQILLNQSRTNLEEAESKLTTGNYSYSNGSEKTDMLLKSCDLSQSLSLSKCVNDLNRCGIGTNCHDHLKTLACDYLPILRLLASGENSRQIVSTKRRYVIVAIHLL